MEDAIKLVFRSAEQCRKWYDVSKMEQMRKMARTPHVACTSQHFRISDG